MQFFLFFCEKMSGKLRFRGRAGLKTHYIKLWSISFKKYLYVEPALGVKQGSIDNLKKAFSVFSPSAEGEKKHLFIYITASQCITAVMHLEMSIIHNLGFRWLLVGLWPNLAARGGGNLVL